MEDRRQNVLLNAPVNVIVDNRDPCHHLLIEQSNAVSAELVIDEHSLFFFDLSFALDDNAVAIAVICRNQMRENLDLMTTAFPISHHEGGNYWSAAR